MMRAQVHRIWRAAVIAAACVAVTPAFAKTSEDSFYEAYFLDTEARKPEAAIELYERALRKDKLSADLERVATTRLAMCREDVASRDLAGLMPPQTFAYVEVGPIGHQVKSLLGQVGLLGGGSGNETGLAVQQALVDELLGMRGAALAVTGIDFDREEPKGVLVVHPGDLEVIRAALRTVLPVGGIPQKPIGGFPTFDIEGEVFVTLTHRLVIASKERAQIEGVVSRLQDINTPSLADEAAIDAIGDARGKSLVSFFVRTEPIQPMIDGLLAQAGGQDPEFAMVNAMLDLRSIRALSGHVGVADTGLEADVALQLADGHRNLVYNLIRTNPVDRKTLSSMPAGAAVAALVGLSGYQPANGARGQEATAEVVTALDLGRELFANIAGIGIYVMPAGDGRSASGPIPNVGAAITVNDPDASEAIWRQLLGLACLASGAEQPQGESETIGSVDVTRYAFSGGPAVRFTSIDNTMLVGLTRSAMEHGIRTVRGGESILADPAYANVVNGISPDCTKVVMVHPGRVFTAMSPMMDDGDRKELAPFMPLLEETVASLTVSHGDSRLAVALRVSGLPEVSGVINQLIAGHREEKASWQAIRRQASRGSYDDAIRELDSLMERKPGQLDLMEKKFELLAQSGDVGGATSVGESVYQQIKNDATALNNFAWELLTEDPFKGQYTRLASKMSERCNQLSPDNWMFVDTLAWARFEAGDLDAAVELERKAIALAGDDPSDTLFETLERFEEKLQASN